MRWLRITTRSGKTIFEWPKPHLVADNSVAIAVQYVNRIIADAIARNASAIRFGPKDPALDDSLPIKYQIDGPWKDVDAVRREFSGVVINRLKSMADLNFWRDDLVQTGSIKITIDDVRVDLKLTFTKSDAGEEALVEILRA